MVIKSYPRLTTVSLALSLELALSSLLPATAMSLSIQQQQPAFSQREVLAQRRSRLRFKVPGIRPSRNLEGGAARGGCGPVGGNKIQMKALQPATNIGLTITGKPTFFFQISSSSVEEATFKLLNAKGDTIIYEKTFPLTKTGGVMSFTLPADAEALEVGKEYSWELVANCDSLDQQGNPRERLQTRRTIRRPALAARDVFRARRQLEGAAAPGVICDGGTLGLLHDAHRR